MLLLAACSGGDSVPNGPGGRGGRGGRGAGGPPTVGFVVVQQGSAPIQQELPGRVAAFQVSDVRPQVSGVIQKRLFAEGSVVHQGQTLYQIDPSIYAAQQAQASANLQSARASAVAARTRAQRYAPLAKMEAISKQDYTDAVAQARQAEASVAQNNATFARGAGQHALHPRACADQRPDRPVEGDRRRAGHGQPGRRADHHHPAGPGLRRYPAIRGRPLETASGTGSGRAVPTTAQVRLKLPEARTTATPGRSSSAR